MRVARMDVRVSTASSEGESTPVAQGRGAGVGAHPVAALLPVRPLALLVVVLQVLVLPGHGHGARPVLNLGGVGKRRAAAPIVAGAGVPHRVATAVIIATGGPPPLSLVAPPDRVVAARAAAPLAPGWLLAMRLAVPAAVIVVGTAAVVVAPPPAAGHRHRFRSASSQPFLCNRAGGTAEHFTGRGRRAQRGMN